MSNDQETLGEDTPGKPKLRGTLVMAATSLGNPADIPIRALELLRTADLLVFEEDRPARSFLKAAGVHREYLKFNEHQQQDSLNEIRKALVTKKTVVYKSDQGSPTLADPGSAPAKIAWELGAEIRVVPGPSALTAALAACPFASDKFYFGGFLSRDTDARIKELNNIKLLGTTWAVMDTPYRLSALVDACTAVFPLETRAMVALDISGPAEDYWLGTFSSLKKKADQLTEKLNFVLIGEGASKEVDAGGATALRPSRGGSDHRKRR